MEMADLIPCLLPFILAANILPVAPCIYIQSYLKGRVNGMRGHP